MNHLDLFSGIGGFALAAEWAFGDVEHVFCEIEPFAQAVLKKHWANSYIYGDIRQLSKEHFIANTNIKRSGRVHEESRAQSTEDWNGCAEPVIDLLTGGFPCQPFSQAGRRRGTEDDRYLWPEMLRVIREFNPRWIIGENVGGLVTWNDGMVLEQVHADLESEGYEVQSFIIPAVSVNAPHRRDRIWIVAHHNDTRSGTPPSRIDKKGTKKNFNRKQSQLGLGGSNTNDSDTISKRQQGGGSGTHKKEQRRFEVGQFYSNQNWLEVATRLCRVDDGVPKGLDETQTIPGKPKKKTFAGKQHRLKALGNAIVPQVAYQIMLAIKEI